jgi:hypothetical protein
MPNLEIYIKPYLDEHLDEIISAYPDLDVEKLTPDAQEALIKAFDEINYPGGAKTHTVDDAACNWRTTHRRSRGIADIRFLIYCGRKDMPDEEQAKFIDIFKKELMKSNEWEHLITHKPGLKIRFEFANVRTRGCDIVSVSGGGTKRVSRW